MKGRGVAQRITSRVPIHPTLALSAGEMSFMSSNKAQLETSMSSTLPPSSRGPTRQPSERKPPESGIK
ncbi:hypothetical protein BJY00DRAFT_62280 [Aspergillus carlsbadensis]|nr:hypothetical protein BJY00DRAFT_62280 [Aspergillus carlsbadensis]